MIRLLYITGAIASKLLKLPSSLCDWDGFVKILVVCPMYEESYAAIYTSKCYQSALTRNYHGKGNHL